MAFPKELGNEGSRRLQEDQLTRRHGGMAGKECSRFPINANLAGASLEMD
jgi:hypothetical protein